MTYTKIHLSFRHVFGVLVILLVISNPLICNHAYGNWQATLEQHFDVVETFDNLKDWRGGTGGHYDSGTMPKKLDGSPSIWGYYTNDTAAVDDWIKDHGPNYRLGSSGKSLCINYNNFVGGIDGYGPSRLGTYFGSGSPTSGYKKIHVFMRTKFRPDFFRMNGSNSFNVVGVLKFIDILAGFSDIQTWGTPSERAQSCESGPNFAEYGMQGLIVNVYGGGLSHSDELLFRQTSWRSTSKGSCYDNDNFESGVNLSSGGNATFESLYFSNDWIGIEFIADVGTLGNSDASMEVYIYNSAGTEIGHFKRSGYTQLIKFDHKINKITIGGNRFGEGYHQDQGDSNENRFYVDDFIIDNNRIGPNYFSIAAGGGGTSPPPQDDVTVGNPKNLAIVPQITLAQSQNGSVSQGDWDYYVVNSNGSGGDLTIDLTNLSDDADLYVKKGTKPTTSSFDAKSSVGGVTNDRCVLSSPGSATWFVGVFGYKSANYTVMATE